MQALGFATLMAVDNAFAATAEQQAPMAVLVQNLEIGFTGLVESCRFRLLPR